MKHSNSILTQPRRRQELQQKQQRPPHNHGDCPTELLAARIDVAASRRRAPPIRRGCPASCRRTECLRTVAAAARRCALSPAWAEARAATPPARTAACLGAAARRCRRAALPQPPPSSARRRRRATRPATMRRLWGGDAAPRPQMAPRYLRVAREPRSIERIEIGGGENAITADTRRSAHRRRALRPAEGTSRTPGRKGAGR